MTQPSGTNLYRCYVCEYMHRVTACANGSKFEEKVRAHTTTTTCSSYYSYSLVLILLFIFFGRLATSRKDFSREKIQLIQEHLCRFLLDEVINQGESFRQAYPLLLQRERRPGKGQVRPTKKHLKAKTKHLKASMYIINLNFSMHNMLMCNIISKVLHF
jgi:hypothetical protein